MDAKPDFTTRYRELAAPEFQSLRQNPATPRGVTASHFAGPLPLLSYRLSIELFLLSVQTSSETCTEPQPRRRRSLALRQDSSRPDISRGETTMIQWKELASRLAQDESGQDLIEYALIAALLATGAIVGMRNLGNAISSVFNTVTSNLNAA
jgi:pilus assembly protein Flp/PilA